MSTTKDFIFNNNPDEYAFDTNKIQVTEDGAKLKLGDNPGQAITEDFTTDEDFAYNSTDVEFIPINDTKAFALYESSIDLTGALGSKTGTATGGAGISNGKLDLSFSDTRHVDYVPLNNITPLLNKGCIEFDLTPNYTGVPAAQQDFWHSAGSGSNNRLLISHLASGQVLIRIYDSLGTIINTFQASWSPASGQEYAFSINWDWVLAESRVFIAGTQFATTSTGSGTRTEAVTDWRIGGGSAGTSISNFKLDNLAVFDEPQRTVDYTPSTYTPDAGIVQINQAPGVGSWADFDEDENLRWGDGSTACSLVGGATYNASEKWIDFTITNSYWVNTDPLNFPIGSLGHLKWVYVPDFQEDQGVTTLMEIRSGGSNANRVLMEQLSTGKIRTTMWDSSGVVQTNVQTTNPYVFTKDADHVFDFAVDTETGSTKVYINNNQLLPTITDVFTRTLVNGGVQFGDNNGDGNGRIRQVASYDKPQSTGLADPADIRYNESYILSPTESFIGSPDGVLQEVNLWSVVKTNGTVQFTFNNSDGTAYWHNGSAWVSSDTSFAQSNTSAEMVANLPTFPFPTDTQDFKYGILFPDDNVISNNISNLVFAYSDQIYPTDNPIIRPNSTINTAEILSYVAMETVAGSDLVKHIVYTSGQDRYVTGGSAADSDGTYAQSSLHTEINSDIANVITERGSVYPKVFLHSDDGLTTPLISLLQIVYNATPVDPSLTLCNFDMYIYDHDGPVASREVYIRPDGGFINDKVLHEYVWGLMGTTDSTGWLQADVYVQALNKFWQLRVANQRYRFSLPNSGEADLSTLESFEVIDV